MDYISDLLINDTGHKLLILKTNKYIMKILKDYSDLYFRYNNKKDCAYISNINNYVLKIYYINKAIPLSNYKNKIKKQTIAAVPNENSKIIMLANIKSETMCYSISTLTVRTKKDSCDNHKLINFILSIIKCPSYIMTNNICVLVRNSQQLYINLLIFYNNNFYLRKFYSFNFYEVYKMMHDFNNGYLPKKCTNGLYHQ